MKHLKKILSQYFNLNVEQKYGSPADIYGENNSMYVVVDDGNCRLRRWGYLLHIYYKDETKPKILGRRFKSEKALKRILQKLFKEISHEPTN